MGNVPSSESPEGGRMAPHKLSKPRTTNITTAGLSNTSRPADLSKRRSLSYRTCSVPYGASPSSSPVPMPPMPPLPHAGDFDQTEPAARPEGASRTLSVKSIFRSRSSKGVTKRPGRTNSVGPLMPSPSPVPSTRPTRANSMVVDGSGHYAQTAGWPTTGASSFNYDPTSYEAKRLSYLMETPIYIENLSMMSDTQTTGSRRNSHSEANPAYSSTAAMPRASSDMSLYTPMRRRSLLTPGLATRASPTPPVPRKSRNRYSMPSTPSRRDSFDGLEIGMFAMRPSSATQPESIPRAATPSDDEYAQTGAFKLGTLRITNGSPVTSPSSHVEAEFNLASGPRIPELGAEPSATEEGSLHATHLTPGYLPQICVSPIRLDEVKMEDVEGLQTTSKTTAVEDDLFEVEPDSPRAEVLDVRVDPSAKSHPRPKLAAGAKHSKDIGRSDSGVVASPTSEYSQQSLSKADSGYSSNVSLRSFSKPLAAKKTELASKSALDTPPDTPHKESAILQMPMSASPDLVDSSSSREGTPPLVQEKEQHKDTPGRHNMWSRGRTAFSKRVKNSAPSAINPHSQISALQAPEPSPLSPTSSIMSKSSLSSITRRNGKLHRFLSSGRKPHEAQAPSQPEETDVPTASQAVEASFADHVGPLPLPRKRWDLRAEPSKETLGTIMSVGSAEFDHSPTSHREDRWPMYYYERCTAICHGANRSQACTYLEIDDDSSATFVHEPVGNGNVARAGSSRCAPKQVPAVGGRLRTATTSSLARSGLRKSHVRQRSSTLNAQIEKDLSMRYSVSSNIASNVAANEVPPVSQADIVNKRIRSPPPVSMRTRNNGDFIKPLTRAQSTPPAAMRQLLSRKPSREGIQSYPSVVSQEPSREAIHGYPPVAEAYRGCAPVSPTMPHLNRRLSVVVNTESGSFRRPNWDVQPEHHSGTCSGASSVDQSRHNSLTSQTNPQMRVMARPKLAPLHQRYSYDGYSLQQFHANEDAVLPETEEILIRDNGPYPSMLHKDGQEYVTDPWSGRPMPQVLGNQGRYPPYVPRGHFRNRSMGADQHPAPYRVLHSYNSPAYKNAPIWG
ncbi:hypothetical protein PG997_009327 [Apiospora hydei]|uniref:Proteophosphoglycan ppg4 n=1 Tax=Apiospora hydei TaxID=1337664 RepID=A0ABR1VTS7_9PEZI